MDGNKMLSLRHAGLIIGFTHKTLSEAESDELDEWLCASDENLEIFEELTVKVESCIISLDELIIKTEDIVDIWIIAGLIARLLQGIIEKDEQKKLDEWIEASERHRELFAILRHPASLQKLVVQILKQGANVNASNN